MRVAVGLVGCLVAALVIATLVLNGGPFIYALDDAYIHLDLADQMARTGLYGVNAGEVSAPSSSILWPVLLVPLAVTGLHPFLPLLLAGFFALAATGVLFNIVRHFKLRHETLLAVAAAVALNLPGLALMGMEHTLQIFLTLLAVLGLLKALEGEKPRWWLWTVLILGPLVRYENALVSAAVLGSLLWLGHGRKALLCGIFVAGVMAAFSLFLVHLGLDPFPASTYVKKLRFGTDDFWVFWGKSLLPVLVNPLALLLLLGALTLPFVTLLNWRTIRSPRWAVLAALSGVLALHIFLGRFSVLDTPRYEFYALAFVAPLLFWLFPHRLALPLLLVSAIPGTLCSLYDAPRAAHSIYLQQYQMQRLAQEFWQQPVAANDIGLVGYRNTHNVLDLVGLASKPVLDAKRRHEQGWAARLVPEQNTGLVMVYEDWFPPETRQAWKPMGALVCTVCTKSVVNNRVLILLADPSKEQELRKALATWAVTLPSGAAYEPAEGTSRPDRP